MKERRRFRKSEEGMALIYVTLVLVMTMLIIPPLLGFVGGAGRSAQIREDRMLQVYAADAGIEDAYYKITTGNLTDLPDPWTIEDLNGYDVDIAVYREAGGVFKIVSTAEDEYGGNVTIESWAAAVDYSSLLVNALSSYGNITLSPNVIIEGNITLNGEVIGNDKKYEINGNTSWGVPGWPIVQDLIREYSEDVEPYNQPTIQIEYDIGRGHLYRDGDLDIYSGNATATLTVTGTIYVTGDLVIGQTGQDFVLDLNGQTIFCEQSIDIGGKCTFTGSGCIIALGDVYFSPNMQSGEDDFVFVMSVTGDLRAQPGGDFYGSMAGNINIDLQPGHSIIWRPYDVDLINFPLGSVTPGIRAYIIRY